MLLKRQDGQIVHRRKRHKGYFRPEEYSHTGDAQVKN